MTVNNPDKIIFVGEALVGNEAVDQLKKFDRALRDFSSGTGTGKERGIDGMLVTKWDTVDDKVRGDFSVFWLCNQRLLGRSCSVDDLRYRTTHLIRWMWTGKVACVSPETTADAFCFLPRLTLIYDN